MKRINRAVILKLIPLVVLCLTLSACGSGNDETETPEKAILVNVENASKASIVNELTYPGQVKGAEQLAVMSKLSGKVADVMVNTGDYVKAGDVLFTMDETDLINNIKSLEAQIATADAGIKSAQTGVALAGGTQIKSQLLQSESGVDQASKGVEQARLTLEQREMSLTQAQNTYDNALKSYNDTAALFTSGIATRAQFDQAETGYKNAEVALDQARVGYDMATVSLSQAQASYDQAVQSYNIVSGESLSESTRRAQDALDQATAQKNSLIVNLDAAKERLEDAAIRSPIDGVVSSRNVEPQAMLSAATVPITVVNAETVEVKVNVTELIVNSIQPGQMVPMKISAASNDVFTGEVLTVSPAASDVTSAFEVVIKLDNKNGIIKPGMYAEVSFTKEKSDDVVVLPRSAVLLENGVMVVYTAENGRAKRNNVTTGIDNGQQIEITSGINPGDAVIVKGQNYVKDGSLIQISESRGDAS